MLNSQKKFLLVYILATLLLVIQGCSGHEPENIGKKPAMSKNKTGLEQRNRLKDLGQGWYKVTGRASLRNLTYSQAKQKALKKACSRAIEHHSGVQVQVQTWKSSLRRQEGVVLDDFYYLSRQSSKGIVLDKKILQKTTRDTSVVVTAKVKIGQQKGKRDYSFDIQADLGRKMLEPNEEIELTVTVSQDCYLTVLNIVGDAVYILIPNQFREDNYLPQGKTFRLPNNKEKAVGICYTAQLPENKERETGLIKVLATRKDIEFLSSSGKVSSYNTSKLDLETLLKKIVDIPRNEFAEANIKYSIVR